MGAFLTFFALFSIVSLERWGAVHGFGSGSACEWALMYEVGEFLDDMHYDMTTGEGQGGGRGEGRGRGGGGKGRGNTLNPFYPRRAAEGQGKRILIRTPK